MLWITIAKRLALLVQGGEVVVAVQGLEGGNLATLFVKSMMTLANLIVLILLILWILAAVLAGEERLWRYGGRRTTGLLGAWRHSLLAARAGGFK